MKIVNPFPETLLAKHYGNIMEKSVYFAILFSKLIVFVSIMFDMFFIKTKSVYRAHCRFHFAPVGVSQGRGGGGRLLGGYLQTRKDKARLG